MHPADIKAAIQKKGSNLTEIALKAGLSESACRMALLYQFVPAGERAIATYLGKPLHEIWPNRYDRNDNRIIGRNHIVDTTKSKSEGHRQKGAVA